METHYKHFRLNPVLKPMSIRAVTVAIAVDKNGKIFTGMAACSAKDNFNREKGRKLAEQRLMKEYTHYQNRAKKAKKSSKKRSK